MPTYVLDAGSSITLPTRPVTVRLHSQRGGVQVQALVDGEPIQAITPMPGHLVVPRVDQTTTIVAVPTEGSRFTSGTILDLMVGHDTRSDLDPDRGVLNGVDVSGLARRELLSLEPAESGIVVTVVGRAAPRASLAPAAALARDAARELLGTDHIGSSATEAVVAVDASASMLPMMATGAVRTAIETVIGVHQVIGGAGESLRGCLVHTRAHWLPSTAPEDLGAALQDRWQGLERVSGFRAAAALTGPDPTSFNQSGSTGFDQTRPSGAGLTWLITDQVPADVDLLTARSDVAVLILAPHSATGAMATQGLQVTMITVPEQVGNALALGGDARVTAAVVASMIRPWRGRFLP